jgi:hypothetical protein
MFLFLYSELYCFSCLFCLFANLQLNNKICKVTAANFVLFLIFACYSALVPFVRVVCFAKLVDLFVAYFAGLFVSAKPKTPPPRIENPHPKRILEHCIQSRLSSPGWVNPPLSEEGYC